ncbi:hypothetical protein [Confluentibacter lentus]|uniref:hypothetical protein n=1 Tax=Confluentibacter lentus TaxID=1699412 RepID=UPI000C287B34|nr:hypothetical protein [Confluentibacter lentus]
MNTIKTLLVLVAILTLNACATTAKFPVSNLVPAADITAKKKTDSHNNITLEITAQNLASPDRLNPSGNNYSVWIVTKEHGTKNVGRLTVKNGKKSTFKTVTPFDFNELFITVENQGDLKTPTGREISRTKI